MITIIITSAASRYQIKNRQDKVNTSFLLLEIKIASLVQEN